MKRNLLTIAAVSVIALGGFAVAQAENSAMGSHGRRHHHDQGHGFAIEHLTKALNLTADQQAKLQPIVEKARPEIIAIHKEAMEKMQKVMDNTMSQIRPLLDKDQQKKFDSLQKAREDLRKAKEELHSAMAE
jgi:Spy/CpxP family protein refolding chaperone